MGNRSTRGIRFIFPNNAEALLSTVIAKNSHRTTKMDMRDVFKIKDDARRGMPCVPISQVARSSHHRGTVIGGLRNGKYLPRGGQRLLYLRHAFNCNFIRKLRDLPVGQILEGFNVLFFDESSAHLVPRYWQNDLVAAYSYFQETALLADRRSCLGTGLDCVLPSTLFSEGRSKPKMAPPPRTFPAELAISGRSQLAEEGLG